MQYGYDSIYETLGNNIRKRREELGLSQSQLADMIGLQDHHQTISRWENGKRFYLDKLDNLCNALRCDYGHLFGLYNESDKRTADIKSVTGLSVQAIEKLTELQSSHDTDALSIIDMFIRECTKGSVGNPSLVDLIKEYKDASKNLQELEDLPDDHTAKVGKYTVKVEHVEKSMKNPSYKVGLL